MTEEKNSTFLVKMTVKFGSFGSLLFLWVEDNASMRNLLSYWVCECNKFILFGLKNLWAITQKVQILDEGCTMVIQ